MLAIFTLAHNILSFSCVKRMWDYAAKCTPFFISESVSLAIIVITLMIIVIHEMYTYWQIRRDKDRIRCCAHRKWSVDCRRKMHLRPIATLNLANSCSVTSLNNIKAVDKMDKTDIAKNEEKCTFVTERYNKYSNTTTKDNNKEKANYKQMQENVLESRSANKLECMKTKEQLLIHEIQNANSEGTIMPSDHTVKRKDEENKNDITVGDSVETDIDATREMRRCLLIEQSSISVVDSTPSKETLITTQLELEEEEEEEEMSARHTSNVYERDGNVCNKTNNAETDIDCQNEKTLLTFSPLLSSLDREQKITTEVVTNINVITNSRLENEIKAHWAERQSEPELSEELPKVAHVIPECNKKTNNSFASVKTPSLLCSSLLTKLLPSTSSSSFASSNAATNSSYIFGLSSSTSMYPAEDVEHHVSQETRSTLLTNYSPSSKRQVSLLSFIPSNWEDERRCIHEKCKENAAALLEARRALALSELHINTDCASIEKT